MLHPAEEYHVKRNEEGHFGPLFLLKAPGRRTMNLSSNKHLLLPI